MAEQDQPKRRRLNADQRRALQSAELQVFVQQYGRKAQKNTEPNDRKVEQAIRQMKPDELDRLLRDDED